MIPDHEDADPERGAAHLVARARAGDMAAFRALHDTHVRRVYALALRLMADGADAEELTQDVFVAAWRQLRTYRGTARFSTWLHGITVRLSRQRWRSMLRRRAREAQYASNYSTVLGTAMPDADLQLEHALAQLPRRMRTALVLHAIEGYTQAETAQMMGIAEGTVKAHVHRARTLLAERMDNDG